jgi:signal transduction histidine kinase
MSAAPQLEFEAMLAQLVERADEMMQSQRRLRELFRVGQVLTSSLDLPTVLRQIVETGVELIGARYAAMGVIATDGQRLEQFIHVGMDAATAEQIGHLPEGKGLLGVLIDDPQTVRLGRISDDARSSGFPAHHPPMESFLGVPIRVRDEVYGNLYLTDSVNGEFSSDDEALAQALAATAGVAINNARLFEDSTFRERWARTLADLSRRLLNDEGDEPLAHFMNEVLELADADLVAIVVVDPDGEEVVIQRAAGENADRLESVKLPIEGTVAGQAIRSGEPVLVSEVSVPRALQEQLDLGSAMVIPFPTADGRGGALSINRKRGRPSYDERDLEMGTSFAGHVGVALERRESRSAFRKMALLEDRSRIARDLHDHVIQRLFAAGLGLQATATSVEPAAASRITTSIAEIDGAIAQIRQSIFALDQVPDTTAESFRSRVLEILDRVADQLPNRPRVTFHGPVDLMISGDVIDDVVAVVTEGLANVVRHAEAEHADVEIAVGSGEITVRVDDDGHGPGESPRLSGLKNLRDRAAARGGTFDVSPRKPSGTRLEWTIPS